jgi:hypothetical protein
MSDTDTPHLPVFPDLEHERKRAKELLRALREADGVAMARLRSHHPRFAKTTVDRRQAADVKLHDAQWVIAREYGFPSWPALKRHIEAVTPGSDAAPPNEESATAPGGIFPCRFERALRAVGNSFSTSLTFHNMSAHNVSLFRLDEDGQRYAVRTLRSGESCLQQTHISHPWVVVDAGGRCMGIVLPGSSVRAVTISQRSLTAQEPPGASSVPLRCSFCGKSQHDVRKLIAGPSVFICDECVELCEEIVKMPEEAFAVPTPEELPALPTEVLLSRLRFQHRSVERLRADLERFRADLKKTADKLRGREVGWATMAEMLGTSPQAAEERLS